MHNLKAMYCRLALTGGVSRLSVLGNESLPDTAGLRTIKSECLALPQLHCAGRSKGRGTCPEGILPVLWAGTRPLANGLGQEFGPGRVMPVGEWRQGSRSQCWSMVVRFGESAAESPSFRRKRRPGAFYGFGVPQPVVG